MQQVDSKRCYLPYLGDNIETVDMAPGELGPHAQMQRVVVRAKSRNEHQAAQHTERNDDERNQPV